MNKPTLVEPGVKYFINGSLKECRKFKDKHQNIFFNLGMIGLFVFIFGGLLLYRYKGKITPQEQYEKNKKKKEYILTKLNYLHDVKRRKNMITDLPTTWDNPDLEIMNRR